MAKLNDPLQRVMNLLVLVSGFIKKGIAGIRKKVQKSEFLEVVYVPLKDLKIDPKYQRLINLTFIEKAKVFDPKLVKPLSIFKRPNGDLFIADGQHTACLAAMYVEDAESFELPCQIQVHPADFTTEQCEEAEAEYFKRFNFLRNNVGTIEKLRADIAQGLEYALNMLDKLESLGIHVQGIGDESGEEVFGYKMLSTSIGKYGISYTKKAVDLCKFHLAKGKMTKPMDGSMIFALAAAFHFADNYLGKEQRYENFVKYLSGSITLKTVKEWKNKSAGQIQDEIMLGRFIEHYNDGVGYKHHSGPTIGLVKNDSLFSQWKDDPIHNKTRDKDEEES
jgi:hypothetical protein